MTGGIYSGLVVLKIAAFGCYLLGRPGENDGDCVIQFRSENCFKNAALNIPNGFSHDIYQPGALSPLQACQHQQSGHNQNTLTVTTPFSDGTPYGNTRPCCWNLNMLVPYLEMTPSEFQRDNHWKPVLDDNTEYPNVMIQLIWNIIQIHLGFWL
ncbi:hypothetical protein BDR05DRAFT_950683 [Suillus weaverae]|nr:hypothetical protein BDR05DRAFT_950683 [Suillus weaverae]